MENQKQNMAVAEVQLTYKTKIKASDRPKINKAGYYGSNSASDFGRMMPLISVQLVPF